MLISGTSGQTASFGSYALNRSKTGRESTEAVYPRPSRKILDLSQSFPNSVPRVQSVCSKTETRFPVSCLL
jgi:hypothetical protein